MTNQPEFSALAAYAELVEKNKPAPKVYIADAEPLVWLISTLFTQEFMDKYLIITSFLAGFRLNDRNAPTYQDISSFIEKHEQAAACFKGAQKAIDDGQIEKHNPAVNEWGEILELQLPEKVKSFSFYTWAYHKFPFPDYLMPSLQALVQREATIKFSKNQHEHSYPAITQEQFLQKSKEPLWQLGTAILYLIGRRSRNDKEADFVNSDKTAQQILKYALDAYKIGQLELFDIGELVGAVDLKDILPATVKPLPFIEWAKGLPLNIPMLLPQSKPRQPLRDMPNYDYWAKQSSWEIDEASALLTGIKPDLFEKHLCGIAHSLPLSQNTKRCLEIHETLKRDCENKFKTNIFLKNSPLVYIKWAQDRGYEPPDELRQAITEFKHLHEKDSESSDAEMPRPAYCTQEMKLMYEAVEKFWSHYDLANPDPSKAYLKKEVTEWLIEQAQKRGITLSNNLAGAMDTIMRCPKARQGGNV